MSDWEESDSESAGAGKPSTAGKTQPPPVKKPVKSSKWEGEDEEEAVASDWEDSSEEEEVRPVVAPPKKKGTLKAKLAEKEAEKAARRAEGEDSQEYDSDAVLNPADKARLAKERELKSDLGNAADLLGAAAYGGTSNADLDALVSAQPRTKEDFLKLANQIVEVVIKRHQNKPLYAAFVEDLSRSLVQPLKDVEVRKVASGLTTLANEKQKAQREAASGKKKTKGAAKPGLVGKASSKLDTNVYEESLDDFGTNPDDFM